MKKLLLSFTILVSLLLVGCGQQEVVELPTDPIEDFKAFVRNDAEITSGAFDMNLRYKMNSEGLLVEMELPIKMKVAKNAFQFSMSENAFLGAFEAYYINQEEVMYFSSSIFDSILGITTDELYWIKAEVNTEENPSIPNDVLDPDLTDEEIERYINRYVTVDHIVYIGEENNIKHYQLIVNDALLKKLSEDFEMEFTNSGIEFKIDIYFDKETKLLTKMSADFKELLNNLVNVLTEEELENLKASGFDIESIVELSITLDFSFNNVVVEVPTEVIENAITQDEYIEILNDLYNEESGLLTYQ